MSEKKEAEGLKFILRLDLASADKGKLLELARDSIRESKYQRTFSSRKDLCLNSNALGINTAYAMRRAACNAADFCTNDKLYMIMRSYVTLLTKENPKISQARALDKFCEDFAAKYPQEYGSKPAKDQEKSADRNVAQAKGLNYVMNNRGNGMV